MWKVVHLISVRRKIGRHFLHPGHSDDADEDDAGDDNDDDDTYDGMFVLFHLLGTRHTL